MRISVALCTFNGEEYLEKQLTSILSQTYSVDEIIICDDNSTDNTVSIVNGYIEAGIESIILIQNKENIGTIKNFEKAIDKCTGDIIFLSDQDDIWHLNKVEIVIRFFHKKSKALLLFTNGNLIDYDNNLLKSTLWDKWNFSIDMQKRWKNNKWAFKDLFAGDNKVTGATVAFKKELKNKSLPINVPIGYWHDAWLSLHAAASNGLFFIEESLIQYRIHNNQQIGLPESNRPSNDNINFKESVTYEEFYLQIKRNYPNRFKRNKMRLFCMKVYDRLR